MLRDWVGCGTFSVVISVLLTVLMVLVCQVLLQVCNVCIIVALAMSIEQHKEAMKIQKESNALKHGSVA